MNLKIFLLYLFGLLFCELTLVSLAQDAKDQSVCVRKSTVLSFLPTVRTCSLGDLAVI